MTMHVLLVEDSDEFLEELDEILHALPGRIDVQVARSRDESYELLGKSFLDLVVLDLKIPTVTNALDADPEHGNAVFNTIRTVAPGTPIFVLTGSPAEPFLADLVMPNQQQADIWSEGRKTGIILFLKKINIDRCQDMLASIASAVGHLSDVELNVTGNALTLAQDRLIRIFARRFGGRRCAVSDLGGGLSASRVIRLRITDHQGVAIHDAVAKLSSHTDVQKEADSYAAHVTRLPPAATPRMLAHLEYGAHTLAGVFYGLAEGSDASAFDVLRDSDKDAVAVIRSVEAAMAPWVDDVPETSTTLEKARRRLLSDVDLNQLRALFDLDWVIEFEARTMQARMACCHGDLHGSNILVSPAGAQLIDYGDVGPGPASLDPITLELSLLFHPASPCAKDEWPSLDQAREWGDLDAYLINCPFPRFLSECREWAVRAGAGRREVAASAYSYLLRQLKYDDTDKTLSLALLDGVLAFFDGST